MSAHVHDHTCCERPGAAGSWLPAAIELATLVALASFLELTAWTGRVRLFVAPVYVWLPPAAGGLLLAMAAARLAGLRRTPGDGGCNHVHGPQTGAKRIQYSIALLIPVCLALAVNPQQFSAEGMRKRRAVSSARDTALEQAMAWILGQKRTSPAASPSVDFPAEPTVRDLLTAAEQGQQAALDGRFLTLVGQCSPWGTGDGRRFDLYRMLVTCCIADAQAISIEVVSPSSGELEYGQWIRVGGVVRFDSADGPSLPVLHAAKIEKIPLPSRPYL
jgi:uncharacterized repeat protein (TIGR03943 family)